MKPLLKEPSVGKFREWIVLRAVRETFVESTVFYCQGSEVASDVEGVPVSSQ